MVQDINDKNKRWSPRGRPWPRGRPRGRHILKSLASKPQVLENCPVLDSKTAPFLNVLKFHWKTPETLAENLQRPFFWFPQVEIA